MPRESPYLTAPEAAAYLRLPSVNALYLLRSRHGLRACRVGGLLRFRPCDLDRYLDESEHPERPAESVRVVAFAKRGRR